MHWIKGSSVAGCWVGSYEPGLTRQFEEFIKPGHVVYDVGANVGYYTLLASCLVGSGGKVIAFEPLPRNLKFLRYHVAANHLGQTEIRTEAVCDREGEACFGGHEDATQTHLTETDGIKVATTSLDVLGIKGLPVPDIIKIDVEGAEWEVLQGAANVISTRRPVIFLATHSDDLRDRCSAWLRKIGYTLKPLNSDMSEFVAVP